MVENILYESVSFNIEDHVLANSRFLCGCRQLDVVIIWRPKACGDELTTRVLLVPVPRLQD